MTLKEELEILRGEPIQVFDGDPMDIPCIETSDTEKLCKHPVVSVNMITYNHEPYIREAIEGVMMQQTDFEFELIIGEDCSQDKTREICFEYQKKYPDKIRVLWWHENVSKLGGNSRRVFARCRGEFIALCEGDDYWIDPLKLQKQVDVMRQHSDVGLCFCGAKIFRSLTGTWEVWNNGHQGFVPGKISSLNYVVWTLFGKDSKGSPGAEFFVMTATLLFRKSLLLQARARYEIFSWRMYIGDAIYCLGIGSLANVYYLEDEVSVYRQLVTGLTLSGRGCVRAETYVVRLYFLYRIFTLSFVKTTIVFRCILVNALIDMIQFFDSRHQRRYIRLFFISPKTRALCLTPEMFPLTCLLSVGVLNAITITLCRRYLSWMRRNHYVSRDVQKLYDQVAQELHVVEV